VKEQEAELLFGVPRAAAAASSEAVSYWALTALEVRCPGLLKAWVNRCLEGERLSRQLLARPRRLRRQGLGREFSHPAVIEWLLAKSREAQVDRPARAAETARLALLVAADLPEGVSYCVKGLCLLANARRLEGKLIAAERHLRGASALLFQGTALDKAFYLRGLGLLRWDQRQAAEGIALLDHARSLFERHGAMNESGATWAVLGTLRAAEGIAARTEELTGLFEALLRLDWESQGSLGARAALTMAQIVADRGERDFARATLLWMSGEAVRRGCGWESWLEARARERVGEKEAAVSFFEEGRRIFSRERRHYEACVAGFELAAVLAREGQAERVRTLGKEASRLCPAARPETYKLFTDLLKGPSNLKPAPVERSCRWLRYVLEREGHCRAPFQFG
jgi:hypothetical protein